GLTVMACVLADLIWFYLGRRGGGRLLPFLRKLGFCDAAYLARTERLFARHGLPVVAVAKFFPGLSLLIPPLAGAVGINVGKFLCFDALGSLLYGSFYLAVGCLFTAEVNGVLEWLSEFGTRTVAVSLALVAFFVGYKYAQRRKAAKPAAELATRPMA